MAFSRRVGYWLAAAASVVLLVAAIQGNVVARPAPTFVEMPSAGPDVENPPPIPQHKAAAAELSEDDPRDGIAPAHHYSAEPEVEAEAMEVSNTDNFWRCESPNGDSHGIIITPISGAPAALAAREIVIAEREKDPSWMPTVRVSSVSDDCVPEDGTTYEEFMSRYSLMKFLNEDGSIRTIEEVVSDS